VIFSNFVKFLGMARGVTYNKNAVTGRIGFLANGSQVPLNVLSPTARCRIGVFGNSVAGQSTTNYPSVSTTLSVAAKAGDTTLTLASATGFVDAVKIGVAAYDSTLMKCVQTGAAAGNVVTLTAPLKKAIRVNATVNIYTTNELTLQRNAYGIMSTAVTLLGGRVEPVVSGYGWGGAIAKSMLIDLPQYLQSMQLTYCMLHLFENDIAGNTAAQLESWARRAAAICVANGVVPIFVPTIPSNTFTGSSVSAVYDAFVTYCKTTLLSLYPMAKCIDLSTLWLDTGQPTNRYPLAGWTDGVHPNNNKQYTIAATVAPLLAAFIPDISYSIADFSMTLNPTLTGNGGTVNGGGTKSGVCADSWVCTTNPGATTVNSKNGDGSQKVVFTNGNSTATSQNFGFAQTFTLDTGGQSLAQAVKAYIKLRINSKSNIDYHQIGLAFSGGENNGFGVGTTGALTTSDSTGVVIVLETLAVKMPAGATTMTITYSPAVITGGVAVAMDIDLIEFGVLPSIDSL